MCKIFFNTNKYQKILKNAKKYQKIPKTLTGNLKKSQKMKEFFFPTSYKFGNFSNNLEIFGIIDGLY